MAPQAQDLEIIVLHVSDHSAAQRWWEMCTFWFIA
jgi:hypothetical protein